MEVKEFYEDHIPHKHINIQFRIWINRNQDVLNITGKKGKKNTLK